MKRLTVITCLFVLAFSAGAQGIPLLERVQGHRVQFHYTYSLSRGGGAFEPVTDGAVTLEGNAYVLEGLGLKVISDGSTRWSLDPEAKEAVVEAVNREDVFTNPALFIAAYPKYRDRITVNAQGDDFLDVTLSLDEDGTAARFVISGVIFGPEKGKSDFSVAEKSLPEGYVITDLR